LVLRRSVYFLLKLSIIPVVLLDFFLELDSKRYVDRGFLFKSFNDVQSFHLVLEHLL
jgi:uncharacterized membrane protein